MKKIIYITFLFFSILSFGQIGDPTPHLDNEYPPPPPGYQWDFSKKPYKKITKFEGNKMVDEFDSIGRPISRSVFWNHVTESTLTKYKGDQIVEFTRKQIYNLDETGKKINDDVIITTTLNLDDKGKIIDGKTVSLSKDGSFKTTGYQYYDNKNRLVTTKDYTGAYVDNFYYSGKNLIRKEELHQINANTKTIVERIYKYNKDNQIVFSESIRSIFKDNILTEKKSSGTVEQEYKNKLVVKKVLKGNSETIERNYTYDNNKNLITFIEIEKNSEGMVTSQTKRTKKYENNILVYSDLQDGLSTQKDGFSFTYYFHSDNDSLAKAETSDDRGNLKTEYFYNEYNHLIKILTSFSNKSSQSKILYEIEYF
ncbi:hypothetical protein SAMN06265349_10858 [Flavobacterium resistens]|uniref:YD repeat-containing protein n=1 Tax=Flavobacterium resistens TaxID=443612 RepID=A0A521FC29_9FLAO|nr:hypothetical protein [Flavobacterium resistens]MRX67593.1 hypothetical protein [Flavobacterium resistens]SMO93719.1 hypothetical protein SAMN06265349_10858 [Flavobacterium resistens]